VLRKIQGGNRCISLADGGLNIMRINAYSLKGIAILEYTMKVYGGVEV
jgi:hypothetical protein